METYTITLTANDVNVIGAALAEQPFKLVAETFSRLKSQVERPPPRREFPEPDEMQIAKGAHSA